MRPSFQAKIRPHLSRSGLRDLRDQGRLPGILFGKHMQDTMIHVSAKAFQQWAREGHSGVVDIDVEGLGKIPVMLGDVQRDPISRKLTHADFLHVRMDEPVRVKVQLEFVGQAIGTKQGGIVQTQANTIDVEGLPDAIPGSISVDVTALDVGDALTVASIEAPQGVTILSAEDEVLVTVGASRLDTSLAEDEAGSGEAEESAVEA